MDLLSEVLIALIAIEHFYFLILEMFLWTKPKGLKTFGNSREDAEKSKVLAANQGLYNGFLAAGLIWSLVDELNATSIAIFFLCCIITAGIYGAYSTKKTKLFYIQSLPAIATMIILLL